MAQKHIRSGLQWTASLEAGQWPLQCICSAGQLDPSGIVKAAKLACDATSFLSGMCCVPDVMWQTEQSSRAAHYQSLVMMEGTVTTVGLQEIAAKYGVLIEDAGIALRGLFIINKEGGLEQITVNSAPIGRSVDEAKRLLQAIQFFEEHGEVASLF